MTLLRHRVSVFALLLSGSTTTLVGQTLPFQTYTTKEGLPSNHITALYQDAKGYLWIGTDNGLSLYDGTEFRNFTTSDGLPNLYVTDIAGSTADTGKLWIGTIAGGLVEMQEGKFSVHHVGDNNIGSLCEDTRGNLWCATGSGNFILRNDSARFVNSTDIHGSIIQEAPTGVVILVGNTLAWYRPDGSEGGRQLLDEKHPREVVAATAVDESGLFWIFSSEGRLYARDSALALRQSLQTPLRPSADIPSGIMDDGQGSLWITSPGGILIINKAHLALRTLTDFGNPLLRPSGPILKDREGNIWFGTYAHGLMQLTEQRIYRIALPRVNDGAYNMAACSDSNGHIWISTSDALLEVTPSDDMRWKSYRHQITPWTTGEKSLALFMDKQNRLWIGPTMGGQGPYLCYAIAEQPGAQSRLAFVKSVAPGPVSRQGAGLTFAIDQRERGWFSFGAASVALEDLRSNTLIRLFTPGNGLPSDAPRALLSDRQAKLWCGTWAEGLVVIKQEADTFLLQRTPAIEGAGVRSLHEDTEGSIWIGTRYAGLVRSCNGEYRVISVKDGLLSNAIWSIAETEQRIWCGTDVGLEVVDKQTCKPLPPKPELVGNRVYSCGAYRNEYVWCLLSNELIVYEQPERVHRASPPPVYIRSYLVNGVALPPEGPHEFASTQNSCTFDFVGISFKGEHNVRYQYRMLGHDSAWTQPRQEHSVTYAYLRPGAYEFSVRAINSDGIASLTPARVSFVIVSPVWSRWWFVLGIALLAASILYSLYRYRLYHLMNVERLRLRIANDLHDDVGTNLSSIAVASQIMERESSLPDELRAQLKEIRTVATGTQEMMRDIVWMLNPSNDSLDDFLLKMKETASRLLSDIPFTFVVPHERLLDKVSIEFKRNVFLIFKEALHNVLKHSDATQATIRVTHDNEVFTLEVMDNGKGLDMTRASSGSGLASLRQRAALLGGTIEFANLPEGGTVVSLSVKNHANA